MDKCDSSIPQFNVLPFVFPGVNLLYVFHRPKIVGFNFLFFCFCLFRAFYVFLFVLLIRTSLRATIYERHTNLINKQQPLECISSTTKSRLSGSITSIRLTTADIWNGSNITWCTSNSDTGWRPKYRSTCDSRVAFVSRFVGHFASNIPTFWQSAENSHIQ